MLLVIFIITTPQMMNNLEMTLPSGNPPKTNDKPKISHITVDEKGNIFLDDQFVTLADLREKLEALKTEQPDPNVVVKGADNVDYQHMVSVLDLLQQLNITKVGLATQD